MATTRTSADLAVQVAKNMNFLRPGEELSARTRASIDQQYANTFAELADLEVAYWPLDEIPAAIFMRLSWLISIEVAPSFGVLPIVLNALSQQNADAAREAVIGKLRDHVSKNPLFETQPGEFF